MYRLFFLAFAATLASCSSPQNEEQPGPAEGQKFPSDIMYMQRSYPSGRVNTKAYASALQWKNRQRSTQGVWDFVGPTNIGGRVSDIEIAPAAPQTFYVGAASGGVFKTTDGGAQWASIFDQTGSLSIGDIALSENNPDLVWVGTGEVNAGGGSLAYDGDGVYVSNDAGVTWTNKGLAQVGSIGKILIDPNNDQVLYVGAMGPLFKNDPNRGVYKTEDGGATWTQSLFVSDSTGVVDMAIHPSNGSIVYAASWERIRRPQYRSYGGETSGLYRTTDGGITWELLSNGLPQLGSQKGRISIVIAPSNPSVLYARYADAIGNIQGVYRTDDGGDNWVTMNSGPLNNVGFHWWFRGIIVDPQDENTIYNVDFQVQKSSDGGNTWFSVFNNVHVDQHALAFDPTDPDKVVLGNDGGVYFSNDGGANWSKDQTLPITQLYRCYVDANNVDRVYLGAQDNSTMRTTTGGLDDYQVIYGGDGFQPLVDPTNSSVIYAQYQYGNIGKSTNDGASFFSATAGISSGDRKNWDTPLIFDPQDAQVLYTATQRVYKSINAAQSWTAISPDLTNGPGGGNLNYGTVVAIDVSPFNAQKVISGTDDGNVWLTQDGGENWQLLSEDLPQRWVTKVLNSNVHPGTLYATFSGYRYGTNQGHVYVSTDNGLNWTDLSTDLPDVPVNDIVQDNTGRLFIATDIGVLGSGNGGASWAPIGENLPPVVVNDMHFHEGSQRLFIATYGRSSYSMDLSQVVLDNGSEAFTKASVWPNPTKDGFFVDLGPAMDQATLVVYALSGRVVKIVPNHNLQQRVSIQDLSAGLYLVQMVTSGGQWSVKLLVE